MAKSRSRWRPGRIGAGTNEHLEDTLSSTVIPLRQSAVERSLKQASFDTAGVPLLAVNHSGQILAINSEAMALVGGDSAVGRSVAELLGFLSHRAFARRWQRLWSQVTAEGRCEFEARLPLRSLSLIHI